MNIGEKDLDPGSARPLAYVSLAIFAWNEEKAIAGILKALFAQTLIAELARRSMRCELICVANGCTDRTVEVALRTFNDRAHSHPLARHFTCRVVNLEARGKLNAWNTFVHSLSAPEAKYLFFMDADIEINPRATLWNMLLALESDSEASVSVDRPCKDIESRRRRRWRERLSLAASRMTRTGDAQLCGQLYCMRTEVARNIHLPRDLAACEDGFIKALVCTDFLAHPTNPRRIRLAPDAAHLFEAYTSPAGILRNQKRQAIGQTMVHILVDQFLPVLTLAQRMNLAETLRRKDEAEPDWLKRLIAEHLRRTRHFWRLYPGLLSYRFRRWRALPWRRRLTCLPAAGVGFALTLIAAFQARQFLKAGSTAYWPKADRGSTGGRGWSSSATLRFSHSETQTE